MTIVSPQMVLPAQGATTAELKRRGLAPAAGEAMLIPVRLFPTALILFSTYPVQHLSCSALILFSTYPVQHWEYL
jgi:hypothetical protein